LLLGGIAQAVERVFLVVDFDCFWICHLILLYICTTYFV
jgi:hypothetical protein